MKYDVFISYRRDGGDTLSQLIYDRLTHRGYRVFLDIESLNAGKFNEKLLEVIEECKDMIIVLPQNGLDRCHNEGDWLYRELEHGIKHGKNIVPVLMKGFEWPENIPEAIAEIKNYNGIVDNKEYFDAVIDRLTTLLTSKPALGGRLFKKVGERKKKIRNQAKTLRRMMIGIFVLVLLCVGAVLGKQHIQKQKRMAEQLNTKITLTPSEEMGATEFYEAIEILKKRMDILADGRKYSFEEENDEIHITIPQDVFHDVEIETTLRCYVTRPTEIYLASTAMEETNEVPFFHIERADIEEVKLVDEVPVDIDFSRYKLQGIENEEECQYIAVTVNEEVVKEAKEWIERTNFNEYGLFQDCEEFGQAYYYYLGGVFEKDNTLYFADNYQYSNYLNLILYNYQNETFSKAFYFSVEEPVNWEYDDVKDEATLNLFGKNQCNVDELSSELLARYDFSTWQEKFTEGECKDMLIAFKARLDALGVPYAFGTYTSKPYQVVVKMNPNYMNSFIHQYIGSYYKLKIRSNFYGVLDDYYIEEIEVIQNENGTYGLAVVPTDDWNSYYKDKNMSELNDQEEISLCITAGAGVPVAKGTLKEVFDGKKFVFDNLSVLGIEKFDEENKYFAEFLKALQETEMPASYELEGRYGEFEEETICQVVPETTVSQDVQARYEDIIGTLDLIEECNVIVNNYGQAVELEVICPESQSYVLYVNEAFQTLYNACEMGNGEIYNVDLRFYAGSRDGNYTSFYLNADTYEHCMRFTVFYDYEETKEVKDEFDKVFNEDSFYGQFGINNNYMNDGYITFQ